MQKKRFWMGCAVGAAVIGVGLTSVVAADPLQWTVESGGNGHWYQVVHVPEGINWTDAKSMAATSLPGGYLATITSAAENWFVWSELGIGNNYGLWFQDGVGNWQGPWLGGRKTAHNPNDPSDYWIWDNGEPWDFTAWATGEPNNYGGNETRLQYFWSPNHPDEMAVWNDVINHDGVVSFLVESPVPEPTMPLLLALGAAALFLRRAREA
jgi:hypothetical protein